MEYRKLKVNVVSAQVLKNNAKTDVDCQVSVPGYPKSNKQTEPNSFEFVVDETYLTKPGLVLLFQLKKQSSDKELGSVAVPVEQLFQDNPSSAQEQVLEYQASTKYGKARGTVKFAYSFDEKSLETKKHVDEQVTYVHQAKPKMTIMLAVLLFLALALGLMMGYVGGYHKGHEKACWKVVEGLYTRYPKI